MNAVSTVHAVAAARPRRLRPTALGWLILAEAIALAGAMNLPSQSRPLGGLLALGLLVGLVVNALLAPRRIAAVAAQWLPPQRPLAGDETALGVRVTATGGAAPFRLDAINPGRNERETVGHFAGLGNTPQRLHWTVRFPERGLHTLPPLVAVTEQPFGLISAERSVSEPCDVLVLPTLGLVRRELRDRLQRWVEQVATGADPGDEELAQLRPYRPGDPRRSIHWRASARARELLVTERQTPVSRHLALVLDTAGATGRRLERLIAIAATLIDHLHTRGWCLTLHGRFAPRGISGDRGVLLETLALVPASDGSSLAECVPTRRACLVIAAKAPELPALESRPLVLLLEECEQLVRLPGRAFASAPARSAPTRRGQ